MVESRFSFLLGAAALLGSVLIAASPAIAGVPPAGNPVSTPSPAPNLPAPVAAQHTEMPAPIYALAFSPDGKKLAVGSHRQALVFDTTAWAVQSTLRGSAIQNAVRAVTFLPDNTHIAVGSGIAGSCGNVVVWDTTDPTHNMNYLQAKDTIETIAFSKNAKQMLTASFDSKAHLFPWTPYPYGEIKLEEHNGRVTAVAFSPKQDYVYVTGAMDKFVKVWDCKTNKVVVNFDQATAGVTGLSFLANGDQIVGSSLDGNLYWWAVTYNERKKIFGGYPFRTVRAHEDGVTAFSVSAGLNRAITGGGDHRVCVWDIDNGSLVKEFKDLTGPVYCTAISPDGKLAAAAGRQGVIYVWDVTTGKPVTTIIPERAPEPAPVPVKKSVKPVQTAATKPLATGKPVTAGGTR